MKMVKRGVMGVEAVAGALQPVRILAEGLRREKTGIHARITIAYGSVLLAHDQFNIERDPERGRLSRSAHSQLPQEAKQHISIETMQKALNFFCWKAWDIWVEGDTASYMVGLEHRGPTQFLLKPYIVKGGGTILFAPPGTGKSWVLLFMAVCIENGIQTIWPVEQAKTLTINLERSAESFQRRLGAVNDALGLPTDTPLLTRNARGRSLTDIRDDLELVIARENVEITFLDSLSRAGVGDLNENRNVNLAMDILNGLSPSWMSLGHSPRGDSTHVFGGIHFDAAADVMVQQMSEQKNDTMGVGLSITKANDVPKTPMQIIGLGFDDTGVTRIWKARSGEFPDLAGSAPRSTGDEIADYLSTLSAGMTATTQRIADILVKSRSTVSSILNNDPRFGKDESGREVAWFNN